MTHGCATCHGSSAAIRPHTGQAYRYMKVHGEKEHTFNGKTMTLDDVAATAMKYVNAADVICTDQNREKKLEDRKRKIATPLMSQYRSSPDSTINIVRTGLYKCGMWAGMMDGDTPAWMKNLKQDDCQEVGYSIYSEGSGCQGGWWFKRALSGTCCQGMAVCEGLS